MKRTKITITDQAELAGFIRSIGVECRFVTMDTETEVKMNKRGNPFHDEANPVVKRQTRNGLVNVNYVNKVRRNLAELNGTPYSETEYTPGKTWYVHCQTTDGKPLALCEHSKTGEKYLQYFPMRTLGETTWHWKGRQLTPAEVKKVYSFVPDREESFKPRVNVFKMKSIKRLSCRNVDIRHETVSAMVDRHLARLKNSAPVVVSATAEAVVA
jgi:hypothetical protein